MSKSGCQGFCQMGPLVTVEPDGLLYVKVRPEDVAEIVSETLVRHEPAKRLLYRAPADGSVCRGIAEIPFYKRQRRTVLRECGHIDPESPTEYVANGGYEAARKAYCAMTPEAVCGIVEASGLRGRGGGGFPAGRKWALTLQQPDPDKYVICNGDEGDPGACSALADYRIDADMCTGCHRCAMNCPVGAIVGEPRTPHSINTGVCIKCSACGYASCREQAEAVVRGTAQIEMCIPYMRRLAEQRSDKIIETTPNGIVVLDEQFRILHMNPSFREMFLGTDALLGKPVSYLMDPEPFERLRNEPSGHLELTVRHDQYSRICRQILYALPEDRQFVAIFVDITRLRASEDELGRVRSETLQMAEELLQQQFEAAREIATFLGQSTARNEQIIRNIKSLTNQEKPTSVNQWVWDTTSSKKDGPE